MIEDGFFDHFPCDAMFAMHNMPGHAEGRLGFLAGPAMASSDTVIVTVKGRGGQLAGRGRLHGAQARLRLQ